MTGSLDRELEAKALTPVVVASEDTKDDELQFMPVDEGTDTSECRTNNTFMLFSRR